MLNSIHNSAAAASSHGDDPLAGEVGTLRRHLTVWDLILIGVGGTIGSGIFVLTGQIAAQSAGPLTFLSFAIAGIAACCSGVCYAELSARIPAAGSTYVYAYVCLGEVAAVVAAACLTLEYGVAGAAVARSWGDKVVLWMQTSFGVSVASWMMPWGVNLPAAVVSLGSTLLLLAGVQESKNVSNVITSLKMAIVAFMTIGGFILYQKVNMQAPLAPFGVDGVLRGATTSFFGYLGYDEVCVVAGEALHPARDMPRAVLGTISIVTVFYVLSALALTGMVHYSDISPTSGFPEAFATRHVMWASQLTALGELVTLPVVVLVSLMAQPRLTFGMASDGLLPAIFAQVDSTGNLQGGTLVSGLVMTFVATFIPFVYLNDLISAGILLAFSMTNSCLLLLRCEPPTRQPKLLEWSLVFYNTLCFVTSLLWTNDFWYIPFQHFWAIVSTMGMLFFLYRIAWKCPASYAFGGAILSRRSGDRHLNIPGQESIADHLYFRTPWLPYLPCIGIFVNWYLIAQLEALGIFLLVVYVSMTVAVYGFGCAHHSVGHNWNWGRGNNPQYETVESNESGEIEGSASANSEQFASNGDLQRSNSIS
jgi:APA family basic amino acid/polyamine antiporter